MNENKVLITGAGGFIGWHLVNFLKKKGYWVRGVDIKQPEFAATSADEFILLDLRKAQNTLRSVKDITLVFHLAANMGGIGYITRVSAPIIYDNTKMDLNMIESAREEGVERFFFSSSACVYPLYRQNKPGISGLKEHEAFPCDPDSYYGIEKLFFEKVLEAYYKDYGIQVRIARFHNIYGPYGAWIGGKEKAPAALCRKLAMASDPGKIVIWGDGQQTRSFCYIDDCVEGFYRLMQSDYNSPMNIGSEEMVMIDELADMIIEISGKKISKKYDLDAPQGVRGRNSDNMLMKNVLKWEPTTPLRRGLEITYAWIKRQVEKSKQ